MASEISRGESGPFIWRSAAHGWRLVDTPELSVVEGEMPPGQGVDLHEHRRAQQFFYVLDGMAVVEKDSGDVLLEAGQGVTVHPGERHCLSNPSGSPVRYIVTSAPNPRGDRYDVPPRK